MTSEQLPEGFSIAGAGLFLDSHGGLLAGPADARRLALAILRRWPVEDERGRDEPVILRENAIVELLVHLEEEAAEVIQACTKLRRFGPTATDPRLEGGPTNAEKLSFELGQFWIAQEALSCPAIGIVDGHELEKGRESKFVKLGRYLRHSTIGLRDDGRVEVTPCKPE